MQHKDLIKGGVYCLYGNIVNVELGSLAKYPRDYIVGSNCVKKIKRCQKYENHESFWVAEYFKYQRKVVIRGADIRNMLKFIIK